MSTPIPQGFELKERVSSLSDAILSKHPQMKNLLQEIWKTLRTYPENITLLSEQEIQTIVSGLKVQTQTEFAAQVTKPSASKTLAAKIKTLGANAF